MSLDVSKRAGGMVTHGYNTIIMGLAIVTTIVDTRLNMNISDVEPSLDHRSFIVIVVL